MNLKVSQKTKANFDMYVECYNKLKWAGTIPVVTHDREGATALESFTSYDNQGVLLPTTDPVLLEQALYGKVFLNGHIKAWAEGIAAGLFCLWEFQESCPWLPDWVWVSLKRQKETCKCLQ